MKTVGIGIDTARYGHVASFVNEDRQPAAAALDIPETRQGYEALRKRLEKLDDGQSVQFIVRVDAAGQYAANLVAFIRQLPLKLTLSIGEPQRNRNYHRALSPKNKSDKSESWALARYAIAERPKASPSLQPGFAAMQEIAARLHAQSREVTRHVNQLHNLVARTFPELELHVKQIAAAHCLTLLAKYPTATRIAAARLESLESIPHLKADIAAKLHSAARQSVGCFQDEAAELLVRAEVTKLRQSLKNKGFLEDLLGRKFGELPQVGQQHLISIPGIGAATAAILTAKIASIDRFKSPQALVSYFGAFPEMYASGVNKDGTPKPAVLKMSSQGCDLVRAYLWNAARTAIRCNVDVKALYDRKRAEGKRGDTAMGHCMRKLLHQAYHVWKNDQPFRPHTKPPATENAGPGKGEAEKAASHKVDEATERQEVIAAASSVAQAGGETSPKPALDYAYLRSQIEMRTILDHLGCLETLRGPQAQLRGPCPLHGSSKPGSRNFSVNLEKDIFQCFAPHCQAAGNALDFWASLQQLPLYEAALHLAGTFHLQLTRKREEEPVKKMEENGGITPNPT